MHRVVLLCMAVLCLTVVSVDGIAGFGRLRARQVSGQKCCNKVAAAPKRAKCEVSSSDHGMHRMLPLDTIIDYVCTSRYFISRQHVVCVARLLITLGNDFTDGGSNQGIN